MTDDETFNDLISPYIDVVYIHATNDYKCLEMVGRFVKVVSITLSYSLEHICAYRDLICVDEAAADLVTEMLPN